MASNIQNTLGLTGAVSAAFGKARMLAETSARARGEDFAKMSFDEQCWAIDGWSKALAVNPGTMDFQRAEHERMVFDAAQAGDPSQLPTWELVSGLIAPRPGMVVEKDASGASALASGQRMEAAGPSRPAYDPFVLSPSSSEQIDIGATYVEIPTLNEVGGVTVSRGFEANVQRLGYSDQPERRNLAFMHIEAGSNVISAARAGRLRYDEMTQFRAGADRLFMAQLAEWQLGGAADDLEWDGILTGAVEGNPALDLKTSTVDAVVAGVIDLIASVEEETKGLIKTTKVWMSQKVYTFLAKPRSTTVAQSGMAYLRETYPDIEFGYSTWLTRTGVHHVVACAPDPSAGSYSERFLAPSSPILLSWDDRGVSVTRWIWPCAGRHARLTASTQALKIADTSS